MLDGTALVALDWCELRNGAYDQCRDALAAAACTTRQRVLVCCLHQHGAPVAESEAHPVDAAAHRGMPRGPAPPAARLLSVDQTESP